MSALSAEPIIPLTDALQATTAFQESRHDERRLLVAHPTLTEFLEKNSALPGEVTCTPNPLQSGRVPVRGRIGRDSKEPISAYWPKDNMIAIRVPILTFAIRGNADLRFGDYRLHLPTGYVCLIPPEVPRPDGSEPHLNVERRHKEFCDLLWIRGSENGLELWTCHSQGHQHWGGPVRQRVLLPKSDIWLLFSMLVREAEDSSPANITLCQNLLKVMLALVTRQVRHLHAVPQQSTSPAISPDWEPIEYARSYILDHLSERLTIARLSRATYMAGSQFRQRFHQATGQTFTEYVTQCRMDKAKVLLRDTDWTVAAIAPLIGINPSHMRRLFIRHTGVPPQKFRRNSRTFSRTKKA